MVWFGTATGIKSEHLEQALKDPATAKAQGMLTKIPVTFLNYDVDVIDLCAQIKITERFIIPLDTTAPPQPPQASQLSSEAESLDTLDVVYELVFTEPNAYHIVGLELNGASVLSLAPLSASPVSQEVGRSFPETNDLLGPYRVDKAGDGITVLRAPLGPLRRGRTFTVTVVMTTQLEVDEMTSEYIFRLPRSPVKIDPDTPLFPTKEEVATAASTPTVTTINPTKPKADDFFAGDLSSDAALEAAFSFSDDEKEEENKDKPEEKESKKDEDEDTEAKRYEDYENETKFAVRVALSMPSGIRSVYSPTHFEDIEYVPHAGGDESVGTIEATSTDYFDPYDEFIAFIKLADPYAASVRTHVRGGINAQEFSICALFPLDSKRWAAAAAAAAAGGTSTTTTNNNNTTTNTGREVVFVVDNSGSMIGPKLEAAKAAVNYALRELPEGTLINVYKFGSAFQSLYMRGQPLDEEVLTRATDFVAAMDGQMGGTCVLEPLICAFQHHADIATTAQSVVLVTDAAVENTHDFVASIAKYAAAAASSRVFTLGIAPGVNAHFVQELTRATAGYCEIVQDIALLRSAMGRLIKALLRPVINNATVAWHGFGSVVQPHALILPSAHVVAYAVVAPPACWSTGGAPTEPCAVTLSGLVAGVPYERTISVDLTKAFCGSAGPDAVASPNADKGAQIACLCAAKMLAECADSAVDKGEALSFVNFVPSRFVTALCTTSSKHMPVLFLPYLAASFRSEELAHYRAHVQLDSAQDREKAKEDAAAAAAAGTAGSLSPSLTAPLSPHIQEQQGGERSGFGMGRQKQRNGVSGGGILMGVHRKAQQDKKGKKEEYKLPPPPPMTPRITVFGFDLFNFVRRKNNVLKQKDLRFTIDENPLYESSSESFDNIMYKDPDLGSVYAMSPAPPPAAAVLLSMGKSSKSVPASPTTAELPVPTQSNNPGIEVNPFFIDKGELQENPLFDENPLLGTFDDPQKKKKSTSASPYLNPLLDPEDETSLSPLTVTVTVKDTPHTLAQDDLVLAQQVCGKWTLTALKDYGITIRDLSKSIPDAKKHKEALDVWTTFVVIGLLKAYFPRNYPQWQLVAEKAKSWACRTAIASFGPAAFDSEEWTRAAARFVVSHMGGSV